MLLKPGDRFPLAHVIDIDGVLQPLPLPGRTLTHVVLRRFAGCPICNLRVREAALRHAEVEAAGIGTVVVFGSSAEEMRRYQADLPFVLVPDPAHAVRDACGATSSVASVLHPAAWAAMGRGLLGSFRKAPLGEGDHLALPADLLVDEAGTIVALKYGVHADDQWSVDDVLALAGRARAA
jgi:hypothetical protein